jgi:hypothetical protein
MKVVCIKKFKSQGLQYELTYGKVYHCEPLPIWASQDNYIIKCDMGFVSAYNKDSFVTLEEWREIKLKELGI